MTVTTSILAERVRRTWAWCRDANDWNGVRACFHPDATIEISWYKGSVEGFIEQARARAATLRPEERGKHWIGNARSWIRGARAVVETDAQIQIRLRLEGHLFDNITWVRFFDRVERRDGVWRIKHWFCFFDKDRLDPVIPGSVPPSFYDGVDFNGSDTSLVFTRLRNLKVGIATVPDAMAGGSAAERAVRDASAEWLTAGSVLK